MSEPDKDGIERLKEALNARDRDIKVIRSHPALHPKPTDVRESWDTGELPKNTRFGGDEGATGKRFFTFALIFFALSSMLAGFMFFSGQNSISEDSIDVTIYGPATIPAGSEIDLEVVVGNKSNTDLLDTYLYVEFPEGARSIEGTGDVLHRSEIEIGKIPARGEVSKKISARLFGGVDEEKIIDLSLEYRSEGSNAILSKEKSYSVLLNSSPVAIKVKGPREINAGKPFTIETVITGNSEATLQDLLLAVEYPFGFSLKSSSIKPALGSDIFSLGDIKNGASKTISITGVLTGEEGEERVFRFRVGSAEKDDEYKMGVEYVSNKTAVEVRKPFIGFTTIFDGEEMDQFVARLGRQIRADIMWVNNTGSPLSDVVLEVKIEGDLLDRFTVTGEKGFYRSVDNTIVWDKTMLPELESVLPGYSGRIGLSFGSLSFNNLPITFGNPEITLSMTARGASVNDPGGTPVTASKIETVKISSDFTISSRLLYGSGPFRNTGPIPPRADQETTYTVVWSVSSSLNSMHDVILSAKLPPYVTWLGLTDPTTESITYNPIGGVVMWNISEVAKGTGAGAPPREVSFQVKVLPSISHIGSMPTVVSELSAEGVDSWTNTKLFSTKGEQTTRLFGSDPNSSMAGDIVTR